MQYKPQDIPRIVVTEPLDPPMSLDDHTEAINHHATQSSFLKAPSQYDDIDDFTQDAEEPLVSDLDFDKGNFAPSSPRGKQEWLSQWAEKGRPTRRRATMWTIDAPTAKEAMRVEDDKVFLPALTTETPQARRLDSFGEDYCADASRFESSGLEKWREEDDESFGSFDQDEVNSQLKRNSTTQESSEQSRYEITHHFDELYDWENEGKDQKPKTHRESTHKTDSTIKTPSENDASDDKLDQAALVSALCHKWGPDRFDRWCEEYDTPISEAIWNEESTELEEFTGVNSDPVQEHEEIVQAPRCHSLPFGNPPRKYLRTRRSLGRKEDVLTRFRLERWTEGRDNMRYDADFCP